MRDRCLGPRAPAIAGSTNHWEDQISKNIDLTLIFGTPLSVWEPSCRLFKLSTLMTLPSRLIISDERYKIKSP